jgi:hypothetical protein
MMLAAAGRYTVTIPADEVPTLGLVYRIELLDVFGHRTTTSEVALLPTDSGPATIGDDVIDIPLGRLLVRPNPSRAGATIAFRVADAQRVTADIFDVRGGRVRRVLPLQVVAPGVQTTPWDGRDDLGRNVPNGVYYVRVRGDSIRLDRTLTILR